MSRKKREDFHDDLGYEHYIDELYSTLEKAASHLDYCGYGDNWERECAREQGLPELINKALEGGNQS